MTAQEFRMLRGLTGLTQPRFADLLGVTRDTVSRAERPRLGPTRLVIRSLALLFSEGRFQIADHKMVPEKS